MNPTLKPLIATIRSILMFPLIRVPLLGGILFGGMGISNGFMKPMGTQA
jgi:hypothetical protein